MSDFAETAARRPMTQTDGRLPSDSRRWGKVALRLAITAVLLGILFWQVKWHDVWMSIQNVDGSLLIVVMLLAVPSQYVQFLKWELLAREAGPHVTRGDIHRGFWVGYTLGLVTPGRIGQYGRALALHDCSLSRAAGLTIIERNYSALVVNGLGLLALVSLPALGWIPPYTSPGRLIDLMLLVIGVGLLLLGVFPRPLAPFLTRVVMKLPYGEKLARAVSAIEVVTPWRGVWLLTLSAAGLGTAVLQFVLLIWALGAPIPLLAGMLAGLVSFFVKGAIPIAIGNLGIGEWTAILCMSGLGVDASVAVAASLLLFTLNVFIPGLIGLPFVTSLSMPTLSSAERAVQ